MNLTIKALKSQDQSLNSVNAGQFKQDAVRAFDYAIRFKQDSVIKLLNRAHKLEMLAEVLKMKDGIGSNPLMIAIRTGQVEAAKTILDFVVNKVKEGSSVDLLEILSQETHYGFSASSVKQGDYTDERLKELKNVVTGAYDSLRAWGDSRCEIWDGELKELVGKEGYGVKRKELEEKVKKIHSFLGRTEDLDFDVIFVETKKAYSRYEADLQTKQIINQMENTSDCNILLGLEDQLNNLHVEYALDEDLKLKLGLAKLGQDYLDIFQDIKDKNSSERQAWFKGICNNHDFWLSRFVDTVGFHKEIEKVQGQLKNLSNLIFSQDVSYDVILPRTIEEIVKKMGAEWDADLLLNRQNQYNKLSSKPLHADLKLKLESARLVSGLGLKAGEKTEVMNAIKAKVEESGWEAVTRDIKGMVDLITLADEVATAATENCRDGVLKIELDSSLTIKGQQVSIQTFLKILSPLTKNQEYGGDFTSVHLNEGGFGLWLCSTPLSTWQESASKLGGTMFANYFGVSHITNFNLNLSALSDFHTEAKEILLNSGGAAVDNASSATEGKTDQDDEEENVSPQLGDAAAAPNDATPAPAEAVAATKGSISLREALINKAQEVLEDEPFNRFKNSLSLVEDDDLLSKIVQLSKYPSCKAVVAELDEVANNSEYFDSNNNFIGDVSTVLDSVKLIKNECPLLPYQEVDTDNFNPTAFFDEDNGFILKVSSRGDGVEIPKTCSYAVDNLFGVNTGNTFNMNDISCEDLSKILQGVCNQNLGYEFCTAQQVFDQ